MTVAETPLGSGNLRAERSMPMWHLGPIALLLVLGSFFVGHDGYVFIDEAALLAQVDLVADGSWTAERPLAEVDPGGDYAPMARSTLTDDGFAPFPNHPLHVVLATAASELGGVVGVRLLSVLGVLGASAAAGWLAAERSRTHAAVAMWLTAIASPLVFDANLVLAHAVAAAATGAAFVLVFRLAPRVESVRAGVGVAFAVGALVAIGALLRSEVVLLGAVMGLVAVVHAVRDRDPRGWMVGIAAAGAAAAAYLLEPRWIEAVAGSSPGQKVIAASSRGGVSGASEGALTVLFGRGDAGVALMLCVLLAVAAAVALRLRPGEPGVALVLSGGAVVAGAVTVADSAVVPGLLWAFPMLAVALVSVSSRQVWPVAIRRSLQVVAAFAVLVLVTQYSVGGGAEWGWRYLAVAMPALCAALSLPLVELASRREPAGRLAVGCVVVACLLVPLSGLVAQRRAIDRADVVLERTDEAFRSTDSDIIVATESSFGRYAWPRSVAGDVVSVRRGEEELDRLLDHLEDQGIDRFLLVWTGPEPTVADDRAQREGDVLPLLEWAYDARAYSMDPNTRSPS
jgi:hypothetical protein